MALTSSDALSVPEEDAKAMFVPGGVSGPGVRGTTVKAAEGIKPEEILPWNSNKGKIKRIHSDHVQNSILFEEIMLDSTLH